MRLGRSNATAHKKLATDYTDKSGSHLCYLWRYLLSETINS